MSIRVRNPHHHGRILLEVVVVLALIQILTCCGILPTAQGFQYQPIVVLAAITWGLIMPRRCQHYPWVALYGAVLGAAPVVLAVAAGVLILGTVRALLAPIALLALVGFAGQCAIVGTLCLLVWTALYRHGIRRIVIQDGTLCPKCAYTVAHLPETRCPECGSAFDLDELLRIRSTTQKRGFPPRTVWLGFAVLLLLSAVVTMNDRCPPAYALTSSHYWKVILHPSSEPRVEAFYNLTDLLRARLVTKSISTAEVRAVLGPPDRYFEQDRATYYLYFYGTNPPKEAYLDFTNDLLTMVGYNVSGVNDVAAWKPFEAD